MLRSDHQFALELRSLEGGVLAQCAVPPAAFEPAQECVLGAWIREGGDPGAGAALEARVEPVSSDDGDAPYLAGFRVVLEAAGRSLGSRVFGITCFRRQARWAAEGLVAQGRLQAGDRFTFRLRAQPARGGDPAEAGTGGVRVTELVKPLTLRPASLRKQLTHSLRFGPETPGAAPVFLPLAVLTEVLALTEQAGAVETGGLLVGHLCRDDCLRELGVQVNAQIPAAHAEGALEQFIFTPETWAAARAALAQRQAGEYLLGWWHSHPAKFWSKKQGPPADRTEGAEARPFFSDDDLCLHETVFSKWFHLALVVTSLETGPRVALYGWQDATVQERGFWISLNHETPATTSQKTGDSSDATSHP
jgi:hypothetical protein